MAKKIKFPLEMPGGQKVWELKEFRECFDLETAVGYFRKGTLQRWLGNNYYDGILAAVQALTGEEEDFVEKFTSALGVSMDTGRVQMQELLRRTDIREALKACYPESEVERLLPVTAESQKDLEKLAGDRCRKIYLMAGEYVVTPDIRDVEIENIRGHKPQIRIAAGGYERFMEQGVLLMGDFIPADMHTRQIMEAGSQKTIMLQLLDVLMLQAEKTGQGV